MDAGNEDTATIGGFMFRAGVTSARNVAVSPTERRSVSVVWDGLLFESNNAHRKLILFVKKMLFLAIALAAFASVLRPPSVQSQEQTTSSTIRLRVLSYNIHHGRGTDGKIDLDRLANVIRSVDPDLVAVQEVDQNTHRNGMVKQVEILAARTGLHGKFAKQIDYDGGEYGQAVLSKYPIKSLEVHWLPGDPIRERRIVGVAEIQPHETPLRFATTHLHHARADLREKQATELNRLLANGNAPVIVAGDFNAKPASIAMQTLQTKWRIATSDTMLTFPARLPNRQLDYVAMYPANSWRIVESEVLNEPVASDHRPLLVEIELETHSEPIPE
ncbi:endonuclease/exonuclease/phosphatase family protein [Rhodopirellula europaea 6C]|uniref:Endonuclease/exonuclease/phosphatase family protein n=1 Tax=Rhodopirellula europaea 6C TaxID=1263867 RepID=M2ASE0_9BACT|nr:endonuclease/exonuclease/phosphatase family protein [Rhodopirellula europaea 6C]